MAQRVKFTTPIGVAVYPHLNKPDTQFNPEGVYKTSLAMENCESLVDACHNLGVEEFGKNVKFKMPFSTDEESGHTVMKCKSKYAPKVFDCTGQVIIGDQIPTMWGGSTLKVGGYITTYSVSGSKGISLQLTKVQVVNPVGGGGDQDGFDAVEGGYTPKELIREEFDDEDEAEAMVSSTAADRF